MSRSPEAQSILDQIGTNIRVQRAVKHWSQEEVANRANMQTTQFARIERGEVEAGITKYLQISAALEVPLSTLIREL